MRYIIDAVEKTIDSGKPFVLATIVKSEGSSPRGVGASLMVDADGTQFGTIGGGAVEALDWLGLETDAAHSEFRQDRFLTAIDRYDNAPFKLAYIVRAVSPGAFTHPAASVEDMYRPDFRAQSGTGRVLIAE